MTTLSKTDDQKEVTRNTPDSIRQPVWHVVTLGIFSFGIYLSYWFYKTWRDLRSRARELVEEQKEAASGPISEEEGILKNYANSRPWLKSMIFFAPLILSPIGYTPLRQGTDMFLKFGWPVILVIMFASLFKDLASLIPNKDSWAKANPSQAGFALAMTILIFLGLCGAREGAYLLYLLVVIPVAIAQNWLNQYWESVEEKNLGQEFAMRTAFSFKETLVIILGALWLGLVILDLMQVKAGS